MTISGDIILKKGKEYSIERFHPWIFSGAIQKMQGNLTDGCSVRVFSYKNEVLGYGHYQNGSIAVRMLSFDAQAPAEDFWINKLSNALNVRRSSGLPTANTNAFRLVHGEGDGLPGLIIDVYDGVAVVQAHDAGMHLDRHEISQALQIVLGQELKVVYYKSHGTLPGKLRDAAGRISLRNRYTCTRCG
jgi:23S rRNA (cytosine1962-C5)-methyltransferase